MSSPILENRHSNSEGYGFVDGRLRVVLLIVTLSKDRKLARGGVAEQIARVSINHIKLGKRCCESVEMLVVITLLIGLI